MKFRSSLLPGALCRQRRNQPRLFIDSHNASKGPSGIARALHTLADYAVLAAMASERTTATRLDGRACRWIYESVQPRISWQAMAESELDFLRALGVEGKL